MKNNTNAKKALICFVIFVVLLGLTAWFGTFALRGAEKTLFSSAEEEVEYDSYALDLSSWTAETYRNAPDFSREATLSLAGRPYTAIGYTLTTTSEQQYSIEAALYSPGLDVLRNAYLFRFSYFTRMRESTPHEVTLYASEDGRHYDEVGSVVCRATGDEFRTADIALDVPFAYLKIGVRTFYSYDNETDPTDRGLYFLSSGFALVAEKDAVFERSYFDISYDSLTFVYNGVEQAPAASVSSTVYDENDFICSVKYFDGSDPTREVEPIHAGSYVMVLSVRNRSNFVCFTEEKPFVITKSPLTVNKIDYVCNDSYVVVLHADVVDRSGRKIGKEELSLKYFTSTVNGHRAESASPVMEKPTEAFSVGIIVTSEDFVAPTENTFVAAENTIGSDPIYSLNKYYVETYCGRAFDFTQNAFFSVYGTPVAPTTPCVVTCYKIEEGSETEVPAVKDVGDYRCVMTYKGTSQEFFVTVKPRPVVAFLYTGKDIVKYYDGTTDLFDRETDTVVTTLGPADLVSYDDPDFAGEDGLIRTAEISDVVALSYSKATFARAVGNTYLSLSDPVLIGTGASNYYIHPSFHVLSAILLDKDTFEKSPGSYTKTADTYYHEGKNYVKASFARVDVSVGGTIDGEYYEKSDDTYLLTEDAVFASGKEYFSLESETVVKNNVVSIRATNAVLRSDKDENGNAITCPDKEYTPNDHTAPSVDSDVVLPCYGNGDPFSYSDVEFRFDECTVGKHALSVWLSNPALYDRYLPEVLTPTTLYGIIVPRTLSIDLASAHLFLENTDKEYDGTAVAAPRFTDLVLFDPPVGFPAFTDYVISYRSAYYSQIDVGTGLSLTIKDLTLTGLTDSAAKFLSNYTLAQVVVSGDITPKSLTVYSQTLRVFEGENPRVSTNAESDADLQKRIYTDAADAALGGTSIPATRTTSGEYVLRIDSLTGNFIIPDPGYVLIPMTVITREKARQTILTPGIGLPENSNYTLLVGSVFSLNVLSVEENTGLSTGLPVSVVLSDPEGCLTVDGSLWTASKPGSFAVTLSQTGNGYYYAADPLELTFSIVNNGLTGTSSVDSLYGGHSLPMLTESDCQLSYNGEPPRGNLIPSDEKLVASETALPYTYYFTSDPVLASTTADFSLGEGKTYYVKSGSSYLPASAEYSPYKEYFAPVYSADSSVVPGASVSGNVYYENVFVRTPDTVFIDGKAYYLASFAADTSVPNGKVVPGGVYYEKQEGSFFVTSDVTFVAGKTYYLASYRAATVVSGSAIEGDYYEFVDNAYILTEDEVFSEEKTYYLLSYTPSSVDYGYGIPEGIVYYERSEDVYSLTTDSHFSSEKTYYRVVYTLASDIVADTSVSGEYYELDTDAYRLTFDNVFDGGKTYYVMNYVPVYFISAGDVANVDLYREKGENGTPLEITEGDIFEDTRSYYISVWTAEEVTVGATVDGEWFEKAQTSYVLTTDTTFIAGKTYYIRQYIAMSVVTGQAVAQDVYEKTNGVYRLTEDVAYVSGKEYFSLVYAVAVVTDGSDLNGKIYFEKERDTYFVTTDATFVDGKTYYRRTFKDVMFLNSGNLPEGEYYIAVPTYTATTSSQEQYFRKDVVYHTVSYSAIDTAPGTHITEICYERTGDTYTLTSDRFFSPLKTYYAANYVAIDLQPLREIKKFNRYYFLAQGVYEAGATYYVFDGTHMVEDDVTPGDTADGRHYYAVTDSEFEQGKTYYYLSYPFLGKAPVKISLAAQKPIVTVYISSESSSLYGEEPDLYDLIEKMVLFDGEEHILPLAELKATLPDRFSFELLFAEGEEISPLSVAELEPGVYSFENNQRENYSEPTAFLKMTPATGDEYAYVLASGSTVHTIHKNKISVRLPQLKKYYGESVLSDDDIVEKLIIEGCPDDLLAAIRYNLSVSVQAYSYSATGEYPVLLLPKDIRAVGTTIPDKTYYEKSGDDYYFTSDTVFSGDKTYYLLVYAEAEVTAGEVIDLGRYYILNNDTYIHPEETVFREDTTYYELVYTEADIYTGATLASLSEYYDIKVIHSYIGVDPISVLVGAQSTGHDYGNNVTEITPTVSVVSPAKLTAEELRKLQNEVLAETVTYCDVSSYSDSGSYPIVIRYNGTNRNVYVNIRDNSFYSVRPAKLNADPASPSFTFSDASVLYDGKLHSITVYYNAQLWEDVTIVYDKGSFSEIGNYLYKAVVSKKNYEDLVLTATMSICSKTVASSNKVTNSASVVITDPTCYNGVNGDYSVVLRSVSEENDLIAVKEKLQGLGLTDFDVLGAYFLATYLGTESSELGYSSYNVTVSPADLKYQSGMALYGYSHGEFRRLDFTYENGAYSFSVSSDLENNIVDPLSSFVFVKENKTEDQGVQYKWIYVVVCGVILLFVIGIILSAVGGAGKSKRRSVRRHHRWM